MRYLKVFAQGRGGRDHTDKIVARFYQRDNCGADQLMHEEIAFNLDREGEYEHGLYDLHLSGDINGDGKEDFLDQRIFNSFVNVFMLLGWFDFFFLRWSFTLFNHACETLQCQRQAQCD